MVGGRELHHTSVDLNLAFLLGAVSNYLFLKYALYVSAFHLKGIHLS